MNVRFAKHTAGFGVGSPAAPLSWTKEVSRTGGRDRPGIPTFRVEISGENSSSFAGIGKVVEIQARGFESLIEFSVSGKVITWMECICGII